MKLKSNQLAHIDNNFYYLTTSQAKNLSIDGVLPRYGCAKLADKEKIKALQCGKIKFEELPHNEVMKTFKSFDCSPSEGWIQETKLSWFNGEPVKNGRVYSLHVTKY